MVKHNLIFMIPLAPIGNPYLCKIKHINIEVLNSTIKHISIDRNDITYAVYSANYETVNNLINEVNMTKAISKASNKSIDLIYERYDITLDNSLLSNNEMNEQAKLRNKYVNEHTRVSNIKKKFINYYIDATKLKCSHLSNECGRREFKTSKCNISNFINSINKNNKETIKTNYNNILTINEMSNLIINNNNYMDSRFVITKIYKLFDDYLNAMNYCINFLDLYPQVIRYQKNLLFNIENSKCYFYEEKENDLIINFMDQIFNVTVEKENIKNKGIYIKLYKTPKRNDIVFI